MGTASKTSPVRGARKIRQLLVRRLDGAITQTICSRGTDRHPPELKRPRSRSAVSAMRRRLRPFASQRARAASLSCGAFRLKEAPRSAIFVAAKIVMGVGTRSEGQNGVKKGSRMFPRRRNASGCFRYREAARSSRSFDRPRIGFVFEPARHSVGDDSGRDAFVPSRNFDADELRLAGVGAAGRAQPRNFGGETRFAPEQETIGTGRFILCGPAHSHVTSMFC
jgi:hypothetical protein